MTEINYDELDPGIRELVRQLREAGWNTTDSGDGVSKPVDERVFDTAHVVIFLEPQEDLVLQADVLQHWLKTRGYPTFDVEAGYAPRDGKRTLIVSEIGELPDTCRQG